MSGIAYFVTLVRERWARNEIKEMEDLCELLMRNIEKQKTSNLADVGGITIIRWRTKLMPSFVRRKHRQSTLNSVHNEDPLGGVANLFDASIVFAIGIMVAAV